MLTSINPSKEMILTILEQPRSLAHSTGTFWDSQLSGHYTPIEESWSVKIKRIPVHYDELLAKQKTPYKKTLIIMLPNSKKK